MTTTAPRVTLDPMTEAEYDTFEAATVPDFARQKVTSGEWTEEEALQLSRADHERLLPEGRKSPNQHLFTVRDADSGEAVAMLWLALRMKAGRIEGYIYNIEVREGQRGRGYGRATMLAAIEEARELGAETVGLHVFGHNAPARALYQSLGFAETNVSMSLELSARH